MEEVVVEGIELVEVVVATEVIKPGSRRNYIVTSGLLQRWHLCNEYGYNWLQVYLTIVIIFLLTAVTTKQFWTQQMLM